MTAQLQTASATFGTTLTTTAQRYPASGLDKAFASNRACTNIPYQALPWLFIVPGLGLLLAGGYGLWRERKRVSEA